jgi:glycosyltransferase involved in cell wall biosynthesis
MERSSGADLPLSVVSVTHNGQDVLPGFLSELRATVDKLKRSIEVLLIDDGSTDGTPKILEQQAAAWPKLRFCRRQASEGYGQALRLGLAEASAPLVFTLPVAAGFNPHVVSGFLTLIDEVDVVVGRRIGVCSWAWLGSVGWWLFGLSLRDPSCPVCLFRRKVLEKLPIQSKSSFVHLEILAKLNFLGVVMTEQEIEGPLRWRPDGDSSTTADFFTLWRKPQFREPATAPVS